MRRIDIFIFAAVCGMLSAACTKEAPAPVERIADGELVSLTATIDPAGKPSSTASKTALVSGNKVEWLENDAISIFDKTNKSVVTSDSGESATFTFSPETSGPWYALYPYNPKAKKSDAVISTNLPASQTAVAGTFGNDLNIAVALSNEGSLAFKNVLGYIKFTLTSNDIVNVTLRGNKSETLAGDIAIDYNSGNPSWTSKGAKASVFLAPASGNFAAGTAYYLAVLPQTFANGIELTFKHSDGTYTFAKSTSSLQLVRSHIVNIGSVEQSIASGSDAIVFADLDVKNALLAVTGIDANNDGEISYAEAAAVTYSKLQSIVGNKGVNVKNLWGDDLTKINSFNELQYFTGFDAGSGIYRLPELFTGCTALTEVTLPANIIRINNYAFQGCTALTHISFPETIQTIYGYSFNGCTSLKEVILPNSVISISASAFDGCTSLEKLVLSENLTQINNNQFRNSAIKQVYIPDAVTSIGNNVFYACASLDTVSFSDSPRLATIGDYAFKNCTSLKSFAIPSGNVITSIGKEAFYGNTSMKTRTRNFHSLTSLGESAFYQTAISNITLDASGFKTIPNSCFYQCTSLQNVYVSSSVTTIGEYAFYGCNNLKGFSDVAAGQTGIKIPSGVTRIEQYTFANCRYCTTLSLPEGLTFIGDRALRSCKFTGNVELPSSLTEISARSFECTSANQSTIDTLKVKAVTPPTVTVANSTYELFLNVSAPPKKILVPGESVEDYKEASGWSLYESRIVGF